MLGRRHIIEEFGGGSGLARAERRVRLKRLGIGRTSILVYKNVQFSVRLFNDFDSRQNAGFVRNIHLDSSS